MRNAFFTPILASAFFTRFFLRGFFFLRNFRPNFTYPLCEFFLLRSATTFFCRVVFNAFF